MTNRMWLVSAPEKHAAHAGISVRAPYGLEIIESCLECPHRKERLFCDLPPAAVQRLTTITAPSTYPKGATLFVEGQEPRGVFILCSGKVKLSTSSADGKTLILRISDAGEVLGLAGTVCSRPYHATATVLEPAQANFVSKSDFLNFLGEFGEAALRVSQQMGENYHLALSEMKTIGLSHSATEKLARFVLDWCAEHDSGNGQVRANLTLTHEEIAQIIGASRETVTRLLSEFRRKQLLQIKGHTLIIRDKPALQHLATS
jgi:CRP/FNR family transcriptional regulator, cyclic AMP receptor protein